ncbi:hypothetical protein [Streptomyces sp. NPDC048603]|uniref:hypothetical protein n=1 Tax=Streptomyces sp. NPDC048603 TaxID=3365577 RepID=UPI00371F8894
MADANARSAELVLALVTGAGPGHHHLVVSAHLDGDNQAAGTSWTSDGIGFGFHEDPTPAAAIIGVALTADTVGGIVLHTAEENDRGTLRGWARTSIPLREPKVFSAYCVGAAGEPMPPQPDTSYADASLLSAP